MFILIAFIIVISLPYGGSCPSLFSPYSTCYEYTIILLDSSTSMTSRDAVYQQYDYILNYVIPRFNFSTSQQLALAMYGIGNLAVYAGPFETTEYQSCSELTYFMSLSNNYGRQPTTLLEAFNEVEEYYGNIVARVILFSSSKDSDDIAHTYSFIQNSHYNYNLVVVTPNSGYFDAWNCPVYIANITSQNVPSGLPKCIFYCETYSLAISEKEDHHSYIPCDIESSSPNNCTQVSNVNGLCPTGCSSLPDDLTCCCPNMTPTNPPSINPLTAYNCTCDYNKIWNDIIYLFETSASMSKAGLAAAVSTMKSTASLMNIQKSDYTVSNYYARVGVIGYGATATVIASLGSVDNNGLQSVQVPYTGDHDIATNLESAIRMAIAQFQSNGRSTSKPVIHIYAAAYSSAGVNSPIVIADQFKEYGVIIVYDYVESNGAPDPMLQKIASPGYFIDSRYADPYASNQAFCDANCFCGANEQFMSSSTRNTPRGGCFLDLSGAPSNYPLSNTTCAGLATNGTVAMDYSAQISTFINSFTISTQLWNGLTWKDGQYVWADGTPFSATSSSYSPWSPSIPPPTGKECTMMARSSGNTMKWFQQQCSSILPYICQLSPCDSTRWCDRLNAD